MSRGKRIEATALIISNMIGSSVGVISYQHSALHSEVMRMGFGVMVGTIACALLSGLTLLSITLRTRAKHRRKP